jgi:hypothetical protein
MPPVRPAGAIAHHPPVVLTVLEAVACRAGSQPPAHGSAQVSGTSRWRARCRAAAAGRAALTRAPRGARAHVWRGRSAAGCDGRPCRHRSDGECDSLLPMRQGPGRTTADCVVVFGHRGESPTHCDPNRDCCNRSNPIRRPLQRQACQPASNR